jgi:hypothetical protein
MITRACSGFTFLIGLAKVPAKTVERWLAELKGKGRIEYRGSKKTGGYFAI